MLEPKPKALELDLAFLKYGFNLIQRKVEEEYMKGGKKNGKKNLKKYADDALKKTLLALERKIEKQLTQELGSQSQDTPKEIKAFAQGILRREHIQYLSSLYPKEGIQKEFEIDDKKYTSSQIPIGEFRNCYHRWGIGEEAGLSAFRVHMLKKGKETLIKYYHHSSPVVYEEPDYKKSIEATDANLRQAVKETGGGPLTEVRLLSTNRGPGGDYKQAVATYLSAIRVSTQEAPITVFFHGLNPARFSLNKLSPFKIPGYSVGLETFINTRSTNELLEKTFKHLGIENPHIEAIKEKRKTLNEKIRAIKLENKSEADVEKELCDLLREHYKSEKELLKTYKTMQKKPTAPLDERQKLIRSETNTILALMQNNRYLKPKYNGQLQATLVRLNTRLGEHVATGCNDAKDRDGMVSIAVEANEIYRDKHGKYPDITASGEIGSGIRQELRRIQDEVCALSTPARVAEFVS